MGATLYALWDLEYQSLMHLYPLLVMTRSLRSQPAVLTTEAQVRNAKVIACFVQRCVLLGQMQRSRCGVWTGRLHCSSRRVASVELLSSNWSGGFLRSGTTSLETDHD